MARAPVGSGRVSGGRRLRPAPWPPGWALSANTSREREASGGSSDAPAGLGKSVVGGGSINVATGTGSLSDPAPAPPLREGCSEDAFRANASCLLYRGANSRDTSGRTGFKPISGCLAGAFCFPRKKHCGIPLPEFN